ncbi:hypothetical protein [Lysinibacillus fusiformis]|nr:hypothetical protein [Lysinibacillus fusiformis]
MINKVFEHVLKEMEMESISLFSNNLPMAGARNGTNKYIQRQ